MKRESDEDFCSPKPPIPHAPRRPEKKGSVQSIPVLSIPCSSLSATDVKNELFSEAKPSTSSDTCAICSKDLSHLNELRKIAHVNKCLDTQESSTNHAKATEKWSNTIDCPMCGEPQPPGPHRAAHAKRCGKKYNIAPKELLRLMETQSRVTNAKKRASMIHTKAPAPVKKEVLPPKLHGAPKSLFDEETQLAQALSASMTEEPPGMEQDLSQQFTRIPDPNEKRRKRPRSYAIVELAPRSCRCEVLQKVHDRFLEAFKVRKINGESASHAEVHRKKSERTNTLLQYQKRLLEKLERLERLSEDLSAMVGSDVSSDVQIHCLDGNLNGHRSLLQARTTLLGRSTQRNVSDVNINENQRVVSFWLRYVYSGRIEWPDEDTEKIQRLAEEYGPDDLAPLCIRMRGPPHHDAADSMPASTTSSEPVSSCSSAPAEDVKVEECAESEVTPTVSSIPSPVPEVIVPEVLKVELEPGESANTADNTVDSEDPLQGIQLADSSMETSADVECITIDDDNQAEVNDDSKKADIEAEKSSEVPTTSAPNLLEPTSSSHDTTDENQITMIDMPEELDSPRPSSTRKSPDLFDERSRTAENAAEEDFSWELTRLRAPTDACRPSSSKALSSKDVHSRSPSASSTQATEASVELDCVDVKEEKASGDAVCSESDGIICLDDNSRPPSSSKNQSEPHQSGDPYQDEYYNYHDPFMEAWYEPAEMSQLSMSQPIEIEENAAKRYSKSPVHDMDDERATDENEQSKAEKLARSSSARNLRTSADAADSHVDTVPVHSATQDSFFDTPHFLNRSNNVEIVGNENSFTVDRSSPNFVPPIAQSTPAEPVKKKTKFGSNVKVLKTSGITPMPNYEGMTEDELKRELSKFGLKPMGRKRAIAMLRRIYDEIHPVIDPFTPTVRPLVKKKTAGNTPLAARQAKMKKARGRGKALTAVPETVAMTSPEKTAPLPAATQNLHHEEDGEDEDFVDLGDKTLNDSRDEPPEESMIDDTGILPKDLEGMTRTFLVWLQRPENDQLYNHLLSLQPVLIDELHLRMSRADSAVCGIPKKVLANVLDRLAITFSLPQVHGGRRANGPRRGGK